MSSLLPTIFRPKPTSLSLDPMPIIETKKATTRLPLVTLEMDPVEAATERDKYLAYMKRQNPSGTALTTIPRNVSPNSTDDIDHKLAQVYDALAKGATVINMEETLRKVGPDDKTRPLIAIANASWRHVSCMRESNGALTFNDFASKNSSVLSKPFRFPAGTLPSLDRNFNSFECTATVPVIPAGVRPDALDNFAILWEPLWKGEPVRIVDPILLRPLGGNLFTVIAAWDVSPIEQAILRGL